MANYTIKNLREAEDMAPKFGLAPDMEARFPAVTSASRRPA